MRVISGSARGRRLKTPTSIDIRPSSDKVKESVFNIIQFDIEGKRVLDLFAGTGQFGIEALSRGAKEAVFVDYSRESVMLIRENLRICKFSELATVYSRDALRYLENDEKYDVIFLDPPYESGLAAKALLKINEFDKLSKHGIIINESKANSKMPDLTMPYIMLKEYRYGSVRITKYTRE
jgi:16S rRNA (guanine(966)-N(2))-methyltransferase RsmD